MRLEPRIYRLQLRAFYQLSYPGPLMYETYIEKNIIASID